MHDTPMYVRTMYVICMHGTHDERHPRDTRAMAGNRKNLTAIFACLKVDRSLWIERYVRLLSWC